MIESLTFVSGSIHKIEQVKRYLEFPFIAESVDLAEIQSLSLEAVLRDKVARAYEILKRPIFIDDTSLVIDQLGLLPGPFIKWFVNNPGPGAIKLCQMLPDPNERVAHAQVGIAFYNGQKISIFTGITHGTIAFEPKGTRGFGWDQIFIPQSSHITRGEMDELEYDKTSPRKKALIKFDRFLNRQK